jgi:hypothetical protein
MTTLAVDTARALKIFATRMALAMLLGFAFGCAAEDNDNFALDVENTLSVAPGGEDPRPLRCDAKTQLDCARLDVATRQGSTLRQDDAYAQCTVTQDGDLRVIVSATGDASSAAAALFRVHRNTAPNGTARCEGIKQDATSETGYLRSSCDVLVRFGKDIYAANRFDKCSATVESSATLRGTLSCPLLRTGAQALIVNTISFYCVPVSETDDEAASDDSALLNIPLRGAEP